MDEKRIVKVRDSISVMSEVEKSIQPIVNTCLDEIKKASETIDHGEVTTPNLILYHFVCCLSTWLTDYLMVRSTVVGFTASC